MSISKLKNHTGFWYTATLLLISGCIYFIPAVLTVAHSLLNVFAGSRSTIKVYLFLFYVGALLLYAFSVRNNNQSRNSAPKIFFILLSTLYVLNIGSFFYFSQHYSLPIKEYTIVFNNNEISSTQLIHNHVLKGAMGVVSSSKYSENSDNGTAYVDLLPSSFYILTLLLLLASVFFSFKTYRALMTRENDTLNYRTALFSCFYAILSFSVIVHTIDGGILGKRALISLGALTFVLFPRIRKVTIILSGSILYSILVYTLHAKGFFSQQEDILTYISANIMLVILYVFCIYMLYVHKTKRLALLLGILTLIALYKATSQDFTTFAYKAESIKEGAVVALYSAPEGSNYSKLDSVGNLGIYSVTPNDAIQTVGDIILHNRLLDNYTPVELPWKTCLPSGRRSTFSFTLRSKEQATKTVFYNKIVRMELVDIGSKDGMHMYNAKIDTLPCAPRALNIVDELLKAHGFQTFFIYNLLINERIPTL